MWTIIHLRKINKNKIIFFQPTDSSSGSGRGELRAQAGPPWTGRPSIAGSRSRTPMLRPDSVDAPGTAHHVYSFGTWEETGSRESPRRQGKTQPHRLRAWLGIRLFFPHQHCNKMTLFEDLLHGRSFSRKKKIPCFLLRTNSKYQELSSVRVTVGRKHVFSWTHCSLQD